MKENVRPLRQTQTTQEIRIVLQVDTQTGVVKLPDMPSWDAPAPEPLEPMPTLSSAEVVSLEPAAAARSEPALDAPSELPNVREVVEGPVSEVAPKALARRDSVPEEIDGAEAELLALRNETVRLSRERDVAQEKLDRARRELERVRETLARAKDDFAERERQLIEKCRELREQNVGEAATPWSDSMRRFTDRLSETFDSELFRPWYRRPAGVVLIAALAAAIAAWIGFNAVGPLAL